MAVYTTLGTNALSGLLAHYDVGSLVSAKGIAEGVSNSNWMIETTGRVTASGTTDARQFILTMYERRIDIADLPYFLGLLDHLAAHDCPVPRTIHDKSGASHRMIDGKAVALIEYLPGTSPDQPSASQARAVGEALATIHVAGQSFEAQRANALGPAEWVGTLEQCGADALARIDAALPDMLDHARALQQNWPTGLPQSVIHSDLFPDNVLMLSDTVSGLIDFYFACNDMMAYDLAVTHAAWCFNASGKQFDGDLGQALLDGYCSVRPLDTAEWQAMPVLAQGACMRFIASRAIDWLETPEDALVTRKNPVDFVKRMAFYAEAQHSLFTPQAA